MIPAHIRSMTLTAARFRERIDVTAREQAEALLVEYLAWAEKKHAQDQKKLASILEAWGFPVAVREVRNA